MARWTAVAGGAAADRGGAEAAAPATLVSAAGRGGTGKPAKRDGAPLTGIAARSARSPCFGRRAGWTGAAIAGAFGTAGDEGGGAPGAGDAA
jgi:hypothetical protein